ncbi:hypothetical protein TNCV_5019201 [Trichonephila clavipes]|nr:hypothetical protein TNCV_5019201 [Trichonephila clavipes]
MENVGVKQKKTNYVRSWNVKREEFTKCTFLDEWFEKFAKRQNSRFKGRKTKEKKNSVFLLVRESVSRSVEPTSAFADGNGT